MMHTGGLTAEGAPSTEGGSGPAPLSEHVVQFYEDDDFLCGAVGKFLGDGARAGDALVVIATAPHRDAFCRALAAQGIDVARLQSDSRLTLLDAAETLSSFMRDDHPDRELFNHVIGDVLSRAERAMPGAGRVRAYGEMVDVLWREGKREAALQLEEHWNDLQRRRPFVLLCAYAMGSFYREPGGLAPVCASHTGVLSEFVDEPLSPPSPYTTLLVREVAHRREVERTLRESLQELRGSEERLTREVADRKKSIARAERLLKVTAAIADAVSGEQVFEALVDRVAESVDASTVALWLLDEEGGQLTLARARGYSDDVRRLFEVVRLDLTPSIPILDAVQRREVVWIPSVASLLEQYPHLQATTVPPHRGACLPLLAHGRVLGVIGIGVEETRAATEEEREFLELVARYASQAVERLRLLDAERASRAQASAAAERLGVLSHASRAFAGSELDLESRLRTVVAELAATTESCINIALVEPDGLLHVKVAHHPVPEAEAQLQRLAPKIPLRLGEGVTGSVAETGKSAILPSIDPETLRARAPVAYRAFLEQFPMYALIAAPLRVRGQVIGTVTASRVHPGQTYGPEDLRLLEELADRAAVAIENSRLYHETVDAWARAEQLYRFAQAVVAADRIEAVYEAALTSIEATLETKRTAILTFDADGVMRFRAWHGLSDLYRAGVEGHSPWAADVVAPEPVLVPDALNDPSMTAYRPLFERERIGALAFIPVVFRGRLLGKFMLYYEHAHQFSFHEIGTVAAVANHLASVITRFTAVSRLEETIRYNELFAGALAHDLRNPLSAIMTAAQLVLMRREGQNPMSEGETRPLSRILSSGLRMTTMINQLLDFTRARSGGGIPIDPHPTELSALCAQAVDELEVAHPQWKIRRETVGDQRGTWDSDRLVQVLSNLVANAGQHGTPDAGIEVKLDGSHRDHVTIAIHNHGAVPASLLPHLFDPFRSTQHRRDQSRGLGLGLFIVRELVRAHAGTVDVVSSETAGTTFTIVLPRESTKRGPAG